MTTADSCHCTAQSVNDGTTIAGVQSYSTLTICAKSATNKRLACRPKGFKINIGRESGHLRSWVQADTLLTHPTHLPTGLLEGPTDDPCEKGGRLMSDNPVLSYLQEVQDYLRSSERLLAAATSFPTFSEEEL